MFGLISDQVSYIVTMAISVSALLFSFSYAYMQFKSGKSKADSEAISSFQSELSILQGKIIRIENESKAKDIEISRLAGKVEELGRENNELRSTLALRDPEFNKLMGTLCKTLPKMNDAITMIDTRSIKRYDDILGAIKNIKNQHVNNQIVDRQTIKE